MSDLRLLVPPTALPVTLAEAKLQCGYGPDDDADHLRSTQIAQKLRMYINSAARTIENELGRALMLQTWRLSLNGFPYHPLEYSYSGLPEIWLPKPPFQSLVAFQYTDLGGVVQTVDPTTYTVNNGGDEASRIVLNWNCIWPINQPQPGSVWIDFQCGYPTAAAVPGSIKGAILLMTEFLNESKGENAPMPQAVKNLLAYETNFLS